MNKPLDPHLRGGFDGEGYMESTLPVNKQWQAVRTRLTARRAALNKEIATYPGPITGCDAQSNHLLEKRSGLNADLVRLGEMSKGADAKTLKKFVESCPFLGDSGGEQQ